ncbi:L-fuculokinase [Klebsiella variicola]|uniref:L-fuculokinase n=1 Tax=Klebsiella variicola TaxID=244366 RepID=A0A7H4MRG9_KLEVA|nr:L-fuculokinase [Klebsiella variicola]
MLSSGTWEILMVRSAQVDTSLLCDYSGSTCELDSQPGRYNPGMQWLASGVLEWVRKLLWSADTPWQTLIAEAQAIPPGARGVRMQCDLLASQHAGWQGVTLNTTRGHFYRAALEGLSDQLAQHLQTLENIGRFRAKELLLVAAAAATRCGTRSRPTGLEYRSKFSMMPKPRCPARRCLAGMAWASSLRRNRPERRSRTATAIFGRKLNLN